RPRRHAALGARPPAEPGRGAAQRGHDPRSDPGTAVRSAHALPRRPPGHRGLPRHRGRPLTRRPARRPGTARAADPLHVPGRELIVMTALPQQPVLLSPSEAREHFRAGLGAPTSGWCTGWTQANLIAVPREHAY